MLTKSTPPGTSVLAPQFGSPQPSRVEQNCLAFTFDARVPVRVHKAFEDAHTGDDAVPDRGTG